VHGRDAHAQDQPPAKSLVRVRWAEATAKPPAMNSTAIISDSSVPGRAVAGLQAGL
jgi:hypothetical protein